MTTTDDRDETDLLVLLRDHGPAASPAPVTDAAVQATAAALAGRIGAARPPRRTSRAVGAVLAAAGVAACLVVAPGLLPGGGDVALARTDPLLFDATPGWLPPGLGAPTFLRDGDVSVAQYGKGSSRISIVIAEDGYQAWDPSGPVTRTDVSGRPGRAFSSGRDRSTLTWSDGTGDEVGVTGRGRYADPALVRRVAESVSATPQRVGLTLTVAPAGWQVVAYVSDHHVVMRGPDGDELALTVLGASEGGLADEPGTRGLEQVEVSGAPAVLARRQADDGSGETWALEGRDPAGTAFSLQAPDSLTRAQVLEVAGGVRSGG